MVGLDDEIFVINSGGTVIRMGVRDITSQGRDATGVRVMGLDRGPDGRRRRPGAPGRRGLGAPAARPPAADTPDERVG